MCAFVKNEFVIEGVEAVPLLYDNGYFGRPKEDGLYLRYVEAAFLLYKQKIEIEKPDKSGLFDFETFFEYAASIEDYFELKYIVYKDLRERGYYIQSSAVDLRLYARGTHPGKSPAKSFVTVHSERISLPLRDLVKKLKSTNNTHKELILAVVDEESDITFYRISDPDIKEQFYGNVIRQFPKVKKLERATIIKERVILWDKTLSQRLYKDYFFGRFLDEERLQLSLTEALYLAKNDILEIEDLNNKKMSFEEFTEYASRVESEFSQKYSVYETLKNRNFLPKTGFKFGTHFRLYNNFTSPDKLSHSFALLRVIQTDFEFNMQSMSGAVRLANSVRKNIIFVYDSGNGAEFIEIERIRM
ncbi:MAG: tRNA-intron lyase [Methanosarcinaceae archaeon]|nr:tRNA-intron lyase [Methanosarcinaceae archaeon]